MGPMGPAGENGLRGQAGQPGPAGTMDALHAPTESISRLFCLYFFVYHLSYLLIMTGAISMVFFTWCSHALQEAFYIKE